MNKPKFAIRLAQASDLPAVIDLEGRSFTDPWSDESLRAELTCDDLRLPLICEFEGHLCGYMMAWRVVDQIHILNLATEPAQRRRGIASLLLARAAQEARQWGIREFTLEVRRSNEPGLQFYRKHGFCEVGIRPGYYADNGEDALVMSCPIAEHQD